MRLRFALSFLAISLTQGLLAGRLLAFAEGSPDAQAFTLVLVTLAGLGIGYLFHRHLYLGDRMVLAMLLLASLLLFVSPVAYLALSYVSYYDDGFYLVACFLISLFWSWLYWPSALEGRSPAEARGWWLLCVLLLLPAAFLSLADSFIWMLPSWVLLSVLIGLSPKGKTLARWVLICILGIFAFGSMQYLRMEPLYAQQSRYEDRVVFAAEHPQHQVLITQWRDGRYLYLNGQKQVSTFDDYLFYEPMVHPAMLLKQGAKNVLLVGGETGGSLRELMRYEGIRVDVVLHEPAYRQNLARLPWINDWNQQAFRDKRVRIDPRPLRDWLAKHEQERARYDVIIIDLPDPETLGQSAWYTREFYEAMGHHLQEDGILLSQATSPYFATQAFHCIDTTVQAAGFQTLPLHNQVMTLGEWGWILASKAYSSGELQQQLDATVAPPSCRWLNQEALQMLSRFGKPVRATTPPEVNTLENPVLLGYYLKGNWRF